MKKTTEIILIVVMILSGLSIISGIAYGIFFQEDPKKVAIDYIAENELHYYGTKSQLVDETQVYIDSVSEYSCLRAWELVNECEKYKVDIVFVLAQGELESHFGTKGLARKTNSVWNVGAYDTLTSDKISKNYLYQHPNESIEPYLKLLTTKYLVNKVEVDLLHNFIDINGNRYASYPNYEVELTKKYNHIKEDTDISILQDELYYYSIRCDR